MDLNRQHDSVPSPTPSPTPQPLRADRARQLLRKLRDLNLSTAAIAVDSERAVRFGGCLSADLPAEESLIYRVIEGDVEGELAIRWRAGWLELTLTRRNGQISKHSLATPLHQDAEGRANVPELYARLDPDSAEPREIEHFLRRLIRGVLA